MVNLQSDIRQREFNDFNKFAVSTPMVDRLAVNEDFTSFLSIRIKGSPRLIPLSDIIMITSDSNYSTIYLKNNKSIITSKTLKYWCDRIYNDNFVRVHASYLINKMEICEINISTNEILLTNNINASISRRFDKKQLTASIISTKLQLI